MGYYRRHLYPAENATVVERMLCAGIPWHRMEEHLAAGRVLLDGEVVTDYTRPAPPQSTTLVLEIPITRAGQRILVAPLPAYGSFPGHQ